MQILAVSYVLLLALTALLCEGLPSTQRAPVLALASLVFYALGSGWHAVLIAVLLLSVWLLGRWLAAPSLPPTPALAPAKRLGLALGILVCVAVLAYFKYATFFSEALSTPLGWLGLSRATDAARRPSEVAIPLGISFFTFEFIHYLVDASRKRLTADDKGPQPSRTQDLAQFAAFALFFPTLLAGPIKRYQQFHSAPRLLAEDIAYGLSRIVLGLFKKIALADSVAGIALRLAVPDQVTPLGLWLAMYAYAAQIYFDFSGYSDLAIGAARLLGYRVPENFDWPYLAADLPSFWRRWHISLSSWIRDYLYIPLGGNRGSTARVCVNLVVVMALCGLWHGPAWHFVIWGVWHGLGLAATQVWRRGRQGSVDVTAQSSKSPSPPSGWRRGLAIFATFHFVCFGWLWFAAPSAHAAITAFSRMFYLTR